MAPRTISLFIMLILNASVLISVVVNSGICSTSVLFEINLGLFLMARVGRGSRKEIKVG